MITESREAIVKALSLAAATAMEQVVLDDGSVSAAEVISAYLSMARSAVNAAQQHGIPSALLREALETILLECAVNTQVN